MGLHCLGMLQRPFPAPGLRATQRPPLRRLPNRPVSSFTSPPSLAPSLPSPPSAPTVIGRAESCHQLLQIDGMTCSACSSAVESALRAVPGVHDAAVNLLSGVAEVGGEHGAAAGLLGRLVWWVRLARTAVLWCRAGLADLNGGVRQCAGAADAAADGCPLMAANPIHLTYYWLFSSTSTISIPFSGAIRSGGHRPQAPCGCCGGGWVRGIACVGPAVRCACAWAGGVVARAGAPWQSAALTAGPVRQPAACVCASAQGVCRMRPSAAGCRLATCG